MGQRDRSRKAHILIIIAQRPIARVTDDYPPGDSRSPRLPQLDVVVLSCQLSAVSHQLDGCWVLGVG